MDQPRSHGGCPPLAPLAHWLHYPERRWRVGFAACLLLVSTQPAFPLTRALFSALPIDLIDGEQLCEKLKEVNQGIGTQLFELVQVKKNWFSNL